MRSRLVVWYNTKCPVCDGGINWQRNRLVRAARAGAIEFRDINLRQKMEYEALERAAQAELLRDRRSGPFLSAARMHSRLSRMIARKRRMHVVRD